MTMLEKAARALDARLASAEFTSSEEAVLTVLAAIREPSMAQLAAAQTAWINDPERKSSTIYRAMIDAILEGESK